MKHRIFFGFLFLLGMPIVLFANIHPNTDLLASNNGNTENTINLRFNSGRESGDINDDDSDHDNDDDSRPVMLETRANIENRVRIKMEEREDHEDEHDMYREELRREAEARRAERDQSEARGTALAGLRTEAVEEALNSSIRITLATIDRLEKIADRIDSRIAKIKLRGGDVAESERLVAEARTKLSEARVSVNEIARFDLQNEVPQDGLRRIRSSIGEVREVIRAAREMLIQAVRSLSAIEIHLEVESETETETETEVEEGSAL